MNKKSKKIPPSKIVFPQKPLVTGQSLFEKYFWLEYALVALIIAVLFFLRRNFVGIPMERDEGSYVMYGKWLIEGAKPYTDFYEMKPPGIFLVYGLLVKIFGYDYMNLQSGFCYLFALINLFSYLFFRNLVGRKIALALLPVYGFLLLNAQIYGFTIQAEFFVLIFVMAGLYLFTLARTKNNLLLMICAGMVLGFSVMIKQAGVFYCAFGAFWLLMDWWSDKKMMKFIKNLSAYVLGGIIPVVLVVLWLQMLGVTKDAWFWIVEFTSKYYLVQMTYDEGMQLFTGTLDLIRGQQPFFWFLAFAGLVSGFFIKESIQNKFVFYFFILLSFLTVVPGYRFYGHYWILFSPGLAVAILLSYKLLDQITVKTKILNSILSIVFIIIPLAHFASSNAYYLRPDFDQILHAGYGGNPFPEAKVVGDYLKKTMKKEDELFVLGSEPEIYLYSNKLGIDYNNVMYILNMKFPFAKKMREQVIKDVEEKKPKYLVYVVSGISQFFTNDNDMSLVNWAQKYVNENYNLIFLADQVVPRGASYYVELKNEPGYQIRGKTYVSVWERK